ncbi:MAG: hydantoinase B/oxoprolinase family protein [Gaiellales bacterium]
MTDQQPIDPILFSVLLGRFNSIADEMTLTLEYSAWTSILAQCHDFSCAIYDAVPRQVCMSDALPSHTASLQLVLSEMSRSFEGDIDDGDIIACNDPYRFNSHVGDLVTAMPVFVDGVLRFWSVTKGHQMDTGAYVASSVCAKAVDVWQEGIRIPPLKIYERGTPRRDVLELYLANVRYRDSLEGDLLAQLGSIQKGRERLVELCEEYGADVVTRYANELINYSDRRMSEEISSIPDGDYHGEGWVDNDGYDAFDVPIKVQVSIRGDRAKVDLTGSGAQARGGVNGSFATTQAAAKIPFLHFIDPDIPHNHGCLQHIECFAPEGTIVNAQYPAPTSAATVVPSDAIQDAINKAMAQAIPERVPAGGARCQNVPQLAGVDERTGEPWGTMLFNNTAGQGAARGTDGWPLYESIGCAGAVKIQPVEQLEMLYPMLVEEMEIAPDSMGVGEWLGGPGATIRIVPIAGDMSVFMFGDGCNNPPHGVLGGTPAIGGGMFIEHTGEGRRSFLSPTSDAVVKEGDVLVGISSGGGGYGNPLDRPVERVIEDVRDGIISASLAETHFGLVFQDAAAHTLDQAATDARRAELRQGQRPLIDPTAPNTATWLREMMRDGDVYLSSAIPEPA